MNIKWKVKHVLAKGWDGVLLCHILHTISCSLIGSCPPATLQVIIGIPSSYLYLFIYVIFTTITVLMISCNNFESIGFVYNYFFPPLPVELCLLLQASLGDSQQVLLQLADPVCGLRQPPPHLLPLFWQALRWAQQLLQDREAMKLWITLTGNAANPSSWISLAEEKKCWTKSAAYATVMINHRWQYFIWHRTVTVQVLHTASCILYSFMSTLNCHFVRYTQIKWMQSYQIIHVYGTVMYKLYVSFKLYFIISFLNSSFFSFVSFYRSIFLVQL